MAVWLNDSKYAEHVAFHQETVVAYSEIYKNLDTGILVGNFCGPSIVNITGNFFNNSLNTALEVLSCWKANVTVPTKLQIGHNTFVQNKRYICLSLLFIFTCNIVEVTTHNEYVLQVGYKDETSA